MQSVVSTLTSQVGAHLAVALLNRALALTQTIGKKSLNGGLDIACVHTTLKDLDIEAKLQCLETLVGEINESLCSAPVRVALISLALSVQEVADALQILRNAVEYHESRFFSFWRAADFTESIELLEYTTRVLSKRESTLLKMISIDFSKVNNGFVANPPGSGTASESKLKIKN